MDEKLVNKIVEQVVAALKGGEPARVSPPAAARPVDQGAKPQAERTAPKSQYAPAWTFQKKEEKGAAAARRVFVTAEMLRARLDGQGGKAMVELGPNEFLTPGADDLVDELHLTISRAQAPVASAVTQGPPGSSGSGTPQRERPTDGKPRDGNPWACGSVPSSSCAGGPSSIGLMIEKPTPKVQMVLSALAREGLSLVNFTQTDCPVRNLRSLCEGVAAGQVRVGLAILPFAADAMLLANKVRGVRAVQGARPQSVAAALRHYHANVLVLEHAASTLHEMLTMIRLFAAGPSALPNAKVLLAAIGELEK